MQTQHTIQSRTYGKIEYSANPAGALFFRMFIAQYGPTEWTPATLRNKPATASNIKTAAKNHWTREMRARREIGHYH
jgi:hypothetical protein